MVTIITRKYKIELEVKCKERCILYIQNLVHALGDTVNCCAIGGGGEIVVVLYTQPFDARCCSFYIVNVQQLNNVDFLLTIEN